MSGWIVTICPEQVSDTHLSSVWCDICPQTLEYFALSMCVIFGVADNPRIQIVTIRPPFSFFSLPTCHVIIMWSLCDLLFCDVYCSVMSIVLWPIVQGDSIVPVTPIVLVTLLFSFTISTSSLWPYSLILDFCIVTNWPPFSFYFTFFYFLLVMWSSYDYFVTYCSHDVHCSVTSIVLWPIVQGDTIVPVTPIVSVTLLFSFTISTSSLWPYSLRLDFCILQYRQAIRVLFPALISCSLPLKIFALKASDCLSSYHSHQKLSKSSLDLVLRTRTLLLSVSVSDLTHVGWMSLPWHNMYLMVHRAIRALFPTHPLSLPFPSLSRYSL